MLPLTICILFVVSTVGPAACDSTSARDSLPDLTGFSQIHSEDASPTEGVERQRDNTRQIFLRRRKRYVVRKKRWRHNLLTWRLDRSNIKDEDEYVIRTTLHRAFQEWSSASGARFEEIADGPADIVVGFERGKHQDAFPFDGKDGVVAHAFYPRDGRLHFDADEEWSLNSITGVNLYQTAVHEIGHLLGLEHSVDPRAVMFAARRPYNPDFALGDDDVRAIRVLFPLGEDMTEDKEARRSEVKGPDRDREMTLSQVVENLHGALPQEQLDSRDMELTFPFPLPFLPRN